MSKKNLGAIKKRLVSLKTLRKQVEDMTKKEIPKTQEELVVALTEIDPEGFGVVFEWEGREVAAVVQQNSPTEFWDTEAIVEYLRKPVKSRREMWRACSSRTFDAAKWEAEIANGNIPAKVANQFRKKGTPPKPFISFAKNPTDKSLR